MWSWIFLAGLGREQFSGDSMSMLLYESAQQRDREQHSQSLCFFFLFFPGAGITSLAQGQECFVACSSSWGLSSTLSPFGKEIYRTAEPPHWLFPNWWSLRWKGNPLKGRWWGLKEWIPKLKAWMKYRRQIYISRGRSQPQMHFNLELFSFYSYFPTFPMSRGRQELQQSPRPEKWAKYEHKVNKRIHCHWMQCTALF